MTSFSGGANTSNVFLFSQAKVNNNTIGIHIEKGGINTGGGLQNAYYGMVLMDCAELKNNTTGILGEDVILQIDAFINAGSNDPLDIRPNKIHGSGLYLDICYDDLAQYVDKVPAKGNYWGGGLPPSGQYKVNNGTPTALCSTFGGILDASQFVTVEPTGCDDGGLADPTDPDPSPTPPIPPGFDGDPGDECTFYDGGGHWDIHQEYLDAYTYYRAGWYAEATQRFGIIASVSDSTHQQSDAACKHYINVAKALAPAGTPLQFIAPDGNDQAETTNTLTGSIETGQNEEDLVVFPNPTNTEFTIELEPGNYRIRVMDSYGKQKYSGKAEDSKLIQTGNWPQGLYIIEVRDEKTKSLRIGKVLIF